MNLLKTKLNYGVVLSIILVIFSTFFIFTSYVNNVKPAPLEVNKLTFQGSYRSFVEEEWHPINDHTKFNSFDGDIILRGNFYYLNKEGNVSNKKYETITVSLYFNHIEATIFKNDIKIWSHSRDNYSDDYYGCGKSHHNFTHTFNENEPLTIILHNPHKFGNQNAYNEFLDSIYENNGDALHEFLHSQGSFQKNAGIVLLVASLFVLGVALFASLMKLENVAPVWLIGGIMSFLGGFLVFDSPNIDLSNNFIALNTSVLMILKYLLFFFVMLLVATLMSKKGKTIAKPIVAFSAFSNVLIIILSMYNFVFIYDADYYWVIYNILLLVGLLIVGLCDIHRPKTNQHMFISSLITLLAMIIDLCLLWQGNSNYAFSKNTILLILVFLFIAMIKKLPDNFIASLKAKQLESALQNYRVSISLSQIQHHFLYNSLTAIYYLCDKDPKKAKQAIGWFSAYLRSNLDKIKEEKPISFKEALNHIEIYLKLEKMRFEDELNIVYDIEVTDFQIPSLVVQPLVENAVNHGVGDKEGGGSVIIKTREYADHYEIIIEDDGVGFDESKQKEDGRSHVGLNNVRERLDLICKGKLIINSEVGKGTTATIVIPKEEK